MTNQSNARARYVLRACFEAITPLHVGSGQDRRLSAQEAKPPGNAKDHGVIPWSAEVMRANVGERRAPCLPGASLKGVLQERAQRLLSTPMVQALFGLAQRDTTEPGRCEFRTALSTVGANVRVEARTAIDRVTRTVIPGSLFHIDAVCEGARFDVEIVLPLANTEEASAALQLLESCTAADPLLIGAHTRAGWGRLRLCDAGVTVMTLTSDRLSQWLASDGDAGWADHLQGVEPGTLCLTSTPRTITRARPLAIDIQLCFDSPFSCNDQQRDKNMVDRPNIMPKLRDGRVLLPGTSFLGALRSQAERIARTLGIETRQGRDATVARKGQPPADLCSLLFGCTGWQGLVGASDFIGRPQETEMTQEMLAICRVTGGGKDNAKFRFRGYESPQLSGQLLLAQDRTKSLGTTLSERLLGLLLLTLRDLQDGDVFFGLGRSKGWGHCAVPGLYEHAIAIIFPSRWEAVEAINLLPKTGRSSINQNLMRQMNYPGQGVPAALATLYRDREKLVPFHNPYQFVAFAVPDARKALGTRTEAPSADMLRRKKHSHDCYHPETYSGELSCTLTTVTPTFIGAAQETDEDRRSRNATDKDPTNVIPFTYAGARAVPGTSLRGMIGALIELISNSNMRVVNGDHMPFESASVADLVRNLSDNLLPLGVRESRQIFPAELMLGVVEAVAESAQQGAFAFASKLSFSNAVPATSDPITTLPTVTLKELASPKPKSAALYIRPVRDIHRYISKAEVNSEPREFTFNGTKIYLHAHRKSADGLPQAFTTNQLGIETECAEAKYPWETHKSALPESGGDEDEYQSSRQVAVEPIADNQTFAFAIRFDNLSEDELCTLCAALQPSAHFEHRLGMGKPLGMGSIKLRVQDLLLVDRARRYADPADGHRATPLVYSSLAMKAMQKLAGANRALFLTLLAYGEPQNISRVVHYPQLQHNNPEVWSVKWWGKNNDNDHSGTLGWHQYLNQPPT